VLISLGVEGSGHHTVERGFNDSFCHTDLARKRGVLGGCGGQASFPEGVQWRMNASWPPSRCMNASRYCTRQPPPETTFLVLLRAPVATFTSAVGRFLRQEKDDRLIAELEAHYQGWQQLDRCLQVLPCSRMWFLAYEPLLEAPRAHGPMLGALFGVAEDDPNIRGFLAPLVGEPSGGKAQAEAPLPTWDSLSKIERRLVRKLLNLTDTAEWRAMAEVLKPPTWSTLPQSARGSGLVVPKFEMPAWAEHCHVNPRLLNGLAMVDCLLAWRNATSGWFYDDSRALDIFPAGRLPAVGKTFRGISEGLLG